MSNWGFVGLAYGVTYVSLIVYTLYLWRRRSAAQDALRVEKHRMEG